MANNKLLNAKSAHALEQMKNEIAHEFGIIPGADTSSRLNGVIGGQITRRLIAIAENALSSKV